MAKRKQKRAADTGEYKTLVRYLAAIALIALGLILALADFALAGAAGATLFTETWEAIGIGVVAGLVCMFTSKAAYPVNLISEPIGAMVCLGIFSLLEAKFKGFVLTPLLTGALATLASGLSFVAVYVVFKLVPLAVAANMLITVVTLTVLNAIIVQVLYFPAKKLLKK